ncbi:MAG: sigma-70 family RNA polymerase sigma factor [Acidobacteria bacterium]|nr:sigma-70 family RNA polymerase sigma factor [Acidobacteriota bacterium]
MATSCFSFQYPLPTAYSFQIPVENNIANLIDHLFRHKAGQMIATLTRIFGSRHIDLAEEVVQDALLKAMQQWSYCGIPDNPTAWLIQVARNRALDLLRRESSLLKKSEDLVRSFNAQEALANERREEALGGEQLDDTLGMIFMACHPALTRESRVALTLKTIGGFGVSEIARAFLAQEPTIAQRLVRAKRAIREQGIEFALPSAFEMSARLDSVLEVIYLLFNEGYTAHGGDNLVRADLCHEAIRLGRLVTSHPATNLPKTHALQALMSFHAARLPARTDASGEIFLLAEQDRSLWDRRLIVDGYRHLDRSASGDEFSEYHLQAAIAACHIAVASFDQTDWQQIVHLYDMLYDLNPSPVVALNRAVAIAKWHGPRAGIDELEKVRDHSSLKNYYLLFATLGELWLEIGEKGIAVGFFQQAMACPSTEPERRYLARKLTELNVSNKGEQP